MRWPTGHPRPAVHFAIKLWCSPRRVKALWIDGISESEVLARNKSKASMPPAHARAPCQPKEPSPPPRLAQLADTIAHPLVRRTGLTTTSEGEWALYVTVPEGTSVPLSDLETQAAGFPVVYGTEPDEPLRPFRDREK